MNWKEKKVFQNFRKMYLKDLCMQINCLNRGRQLIFKRVRR